MFDITSGQMKPLSKTSQRLSPQYVGHDRMPVFIYTDKIYSLVSNGGYYFLSRPRRFGKSLLVSTMEDNLHINPW